MRRRWIYGIGASLLVLAVLAIVVALDNSNDRTDKSGKTAAQKPANSLASAQSKACNIFSLANAKQLLGDTAKGGDNAATTSSDELSVTTCSYAQDSGSNLPISSNRLATLLVRAPKTSAGISSNQNQFTTLKPANSQLVAGYGDNAYWDPQYGQLNILKNDNWYILSNGPITPSNRTLDEAKQLADILINKL